MIENKDNNHQVSIIPIIKILLKWRKQLIIIFLGSVVTSISFTIPQIMPPKYKSVTIIYPVNLQAYSKESSTEQMVQLLNSEDVRIRMVYAFDLFRHYDIDSTERYPRLKILRELDKNIDIEKTEFESIEISIYDEDPYKAAAMCDSLLAFVDEKALSLVHGRANELREIYIKQMMEKKIEMDSIESAIYNLRTTYSITDFEGMVGGFSREYYRAKREGKTNGMLETTRINLEQFGGQYTFLKEMLWKVRGQYADYKLNYEHSLTDSQKSLNFHNIVSRAVPAEKKDSPKRLLIVMVFSFSILFFSIVFILFKELYLNRIKQEFF